jgi:hypothetical protein
MAVNTMNSAERTIFKKALRIVFFRNSALGTIMVFVDDILVFVHGILVNAKFS